MRFGLVDLVVDPPARLLDADRSPLVLAQEFSFALQFLGYFFGEYYVAVLIEFVSIFFRVLDIIGIVRHCLLLIL